jgi:hypothetical protein
MYGGYRQPLWLVIGVVVLAVVAVVLTAVALSTAPPTQQAPASAPSVPTATEKVTPELDPEPLRPVRRLFDRPGPLTISVLGDFTSDEGDEWVARWARQLSEARIVTLHMWDSTVEQYAPPEVYGDFGQEVDIWNYSAADLGPAAPAEDISVAQPEEPDLVVYNFGHTSRPGDIGGQLDTTVQAVREQWNGPVQSLVVLQNPARRDLRIEQSETVFYLRTFWSRASNVPAVNVFAAFRYAPGPVRNLLDGDQQPNDRGSRLWAHVVTAALRTG